MPLTAQDLEYLKPKFDHCQSLVYGDYVNGIAYEEDLVSSQGMAFTLFPHEGHSADDVKEAERELYADRDVVRIYVRRVPSSWYPEEHQPDDSKEESGQWLESMRRVLREGPLCVATDGSVVPRGQRGGQLVDCFTASICTQVYDALNDTNKAKLLAMPVYVAVDACLKIGAKR